MNKEIKKKIIFSFDMSDEKDKSIYESLINLGNRKASILKECFFISILSRYGPVSKEDIPFLIGALKRDSMNHSIPSGITTTSKPRQKKTKPISVNPEKEKYLKSISSAGLSQEEMSFESWKQQQKELDAEIEAELDAEEVELETKSQKSETKNPVPDVDSISDDDMDLILGGLNNFN